jgi:hypothetical protein
VFHLERFHDLGTTYVIVDAYEFRRSHQVLLERVPRFEARWLLEKIIRREPRLFARLYEALTGMRPPAAGTFRLNTVANPEALLARMLDAFGIDQPTSEPARADFARFYLLRDRRGDRTVGTSPQSPESQRIDKALTAFGRAPFTHRGETYHLQRAGGVDAALRNGDMYETLSEAQLFAVLRALQDDLALAAPRKAAADELRAAADDQRKQRGRTELLLRRRQRAHARVQEDSGPTLTPSQMRKALERHWVEVSAVDPDGKPVSDVALEFELADGAVRSATTNADGFARLEPVPAGNVVIRLPKIDGSMWRALTGAASQLSKQAPGTRSHRVAQGECLSKIAHRFGLADWKAVWEYADNGPLREKRKSPHVLLPGDTVAVPGVNVHELARSADATHSIEIKSAQEVELQLRLHDGRRKGLDGLNYRIAFTHQGREVVRPGAAPSASDGLITERVPVGVESVAIVVDRPKLTFSFLVGHLNPIRDEKTKQQVATGVEARLGALVYGSGSGTAGVREALAEFQREQLGREQADGTFDDPTAQKLFEMYGV